jgi:FAD binding domain
MDLTHAAALASILGDDTRVLTHPLLVEQLSRDFYWYSPVLRKQLDGKTGDLVVQPVTVPEIQEVLRYCHAHDLAVTLRGAGTGNYGQAVPLRGGVVLDLATMDRVEAIQPDGVAVCQPGARLGVVENEARKTGWELRCYPSTIVKASVGGFLGGGSGGIGSVAHGNLRDFQTVRAIEVVTMEAEPRVVKLEGESVHDILHAWGTNGVITRIWLALTPAVEWSQCAVAFDTFDGPYAGLGTRPLLSDYTWNHTTLWAIRADEAYTYLQCGFEAATVREQMKHLRERFGHEILFHMEFMKNGEGQVIPGAIPLVYFTSEERLNDMIDFCREIGVFVANPHVNNVEGGGRYRVDNVQLLAKKRYDPKGLLNPGKMITFEADAHAGATATGATPK